MVFPAAAITPAPTTAAATANLLIVLETVLDTERLPEACGLEERRAQPVTSAASNVALQP
jgi:hypothetical protein